LNDFESALKEYKEAEKYDQLEAGDEKKLLIKKLIARVESLSSNNTFLTTELKGRGRSFEK
jgi:hypothetical protein